MDMKNILFSIHAFREFFIKKKSDEGKHCKLENVWKTKFFVFFRLARVTF